MNLLGGNARNDLTIDIKEVSSFSSPPDSIASQCNARNKKSVALEYNPPSVSDVTATDSQHKEYKGGKCSDRYTASSRRRLSSSMMNKRSERGKMLSVNRLLHSDLLNAQANHRMGGVTSFRPKYKPKLESKCRNRLRNQVSPTKDTTLKDEWSNLEERYNRIVKPSKHLKVSTYSVLAKRQSSLPKYCGNKLKEEPIGWVKVTHRKSSKSQKCRKHGNHCEPNRILRVGCDPMLRLRI